VTPHRFFVAAGTTSGDRVTLGADHARQIATVLRLAPGERVVLLEGGDEVEVRLDRVGAGEISGTVVSRRPAVAEPQLRLTLALPLLRGDRGEEVVEAVTQLGVSRIVPFTSERSVVRALSAAKRERWERIARESAETARRGRVPEIAPLVTWSELFDVLDAPVLIAWEQERERTLKKALPPSAAALSMVIGPEGGLAEAEVELARSRGAITVSLGPRNLRSETAAIAAIAQVMFVLHHM
jgi:16S rRNA (uracil1498-N3)-methyltransferase